MKHRIAAVLFGMLLGAALFSGGTALAAGLMAGPSTQLFYVNDQRIDLQAYEINGSNYVKFRDIGQAVNFGVTYDAATNSVQISPDQPYMDEMKTSPAGTGDGYLTNGKPVTEENVLEILRQIEKDWPHGTVWNSTTANIVPSTEADHIIGNYPVSSVYGCGGYAAMVSSLVFGDTNNPGRKLDDLSQIRPGDIVLRINNQTSAVWHVTIALESPNEIHAFHITDGNSRGKVLWPNRPDQYDRDNLERFSK